MTAIQKIRKSLKSFDFQKNPNRHQSLEWQGRKGKCNARTSYGFYGLSIYGRCGYSRRLLVNILLISFFSDFTQSLKHSNNTKCRVWRLCVSPWRQRNEVLLFSCDTINNKQFVSIFLNINIDEEKTIKCDTLRRQEATELYGGGFCERQSW